MIDPFTIFGALILGLFVVAFTLAALHWAVHHVCAFVRDCIEDRRSNRP